MVKLRSQEDDPKGKGVDTSESAPPWFSAFQEATNQRFSQMDVMFAEMCALRKQVNQMVDDQSTIDRNSTPLKKARESGSDHFERFGGDDRRFGGGQFHEGADDDETYGISAEFRDYWMRRNDDDDETWTWTEHYSVMEDETDLLEEESMQQFQVPIANSEIVRSIEPGKVDLGLENEEYVVLNENLEQEWDQMNVNEKLEVDGDVERDQKVMSDTETSCAHKVLVKMPSKEKRIKHLKGWKFKFKRKSLVGIKLQIEQYKLSNRRRKMYNKLSTNVKVESAKEMITGNHPRMLRQLHKSRVQSKMRMMNDSWSMRQPTLKIMKSHRKHKWKSKQLQIASNFWINHSHKLADLILRTALTDWRTKNSKGLAYDGCVSLETNLAGFGRGKTEMLATSQKMQTMDLFSFGIYTEMEENVELKQLLVAMERFSPEVIEPKMEGGLICGDVKFHLKHKWRFRLLESFPRLVLLAWINLWFSKAYEFSGQLQDSSKGEAESFPFLNFAAGQHLSWMQNKSEPIFIVSELERKKKLCYKTWMFKYKVDEEDQGILRSRTRWTQEVPEVICFLLRRHFHLHLDCEEPELVVRKRNHDLFIRLHNKLKQQRCPKTWMFKFKADYVQQEEFELSSLQNLEVKVSSKEGDVIQERRIRIS